MVRTVLMRTIQKRIPLRAAAACAIAALACWPGAAHAQQTYSLTGKLIGLNSEGSLLPIAAPANCASFVWRTGMLAPGQRTPPNPYWPDPEDLEPKAFATKGCIPGAGTIMTPGSYGADMVGGRFKISPGRFSFKLQAPGMLNVAPFPTVTSLVQVATSFRITVPPAQQVDPTSRTMATGMNTAPWLVFQKSPYRTSPSMNGQSGRVGPTFTWCPGANGGISGCGSAMAGDFHMIIKNEAGIDHCPGDESDNCRGFGGTMGGLFYAGTQVSSFAQARPLEGAVNTMSVAIAPIEPCKGLDDRCNLDEGKFPFGLGYAAVVQQHAAAPYFYQTYQLTTNNPPSQAVIAKVGPKVPGKGASPKLTSVNFPWTTGRVIVRETGAEFGIDQTHTITAEGKDTTTPMGARNIQLVAGKLTRAFIGGAINHLHVGIGQMSLPEPSRRAATLIGAASLLGLAAWRARRQRAGTRRGGTLR